MQPCQALLLLTLLPVMLALFCCCHSWRLSHYDYLVMPAAAAAAVKMSALTAALLLLQ
jgi:hypothetical protein